MDAGAQQELPGGNRECNPGEPRGGGLMRPGCPTEAVMWDIFGSLREKCQQNKEAGIRRGRGEQCSNGAGRAAVFSHFL